MERAKRDYREFPEEVQDALGFALDRVQRGKTPQDMEMLPEFGSGVYQLREGFDKEAYHKKSHRSKAIPREIKERIRAGIRSAIAMEEAMTRQGLPIQEEGA